jgi:CRISPR/Cas system-associated exonuclease Cas4 (RecB family)
VKLLTIADLTDPDNDWKPLLDHVAFLQTIYEAYKAKTRSRRHIDLDIGGDEDRPPGLHASELCGCLRQACYSLHGTKKSSNEDSVDINMLMRFDMGHAVHTLMQDDFQRMCMLADGRLIFEHETKINAKTSELAARYMFASSTDGIFTFFDEHDNPYLRVGLEIKSCSKDEYEKLNKPHDKHLMQGSFYQKLLDVPLMYYLYYNKSNSNFTPPRAPWIVPFDTNLWNRMESRAQQAHQLTSMGQLPDREEGMPCTWCPYTHVCEPSYTRISRSKEPTKKVKARKLT